MTKNNKKKVLYIGAMLSKHGSVISSMETLVPLMKEQFDIEAVSTKLSPLIRLMDMFTAFFIKGLPADYILIDVFSTSAFYYALIISQLARVFKIKYVTILRGGNLPNRLDQNQVLSRFIFNHSYANVAPSGYLKHEFEKRGYQTKLIPNLIKIDKYPFEERSSLRHKLLYVRSLHKIYNPTLAVKILSGLAKKYPNVELCMIGPDKDGSKTQVIELAKKLNVANRISFTGYLSKENWIEKSKEYDVFINTTNYDNTPISIIEGWSLGFPVVTTNAGGIPYLVKDKENGFVVPTDDADAFVNRIGLLFDNPEISNQLSRNARKTAELYSWEHIKKDWYRLLLNEDN